MTRYILIASGKGGTGKTSCSINLAAAFTYFNKDVILVDANIYNPNLSINLGIINPIKNMQEVLLGKYHILEAIHNHSSRMRIVPLSISSSYITKMDLSNFKRVLYGIDGLADFVFIDGTSGNDIDTIHLINAVNEIIIITNPDTASLTDAMKTIRLANYYKKPVRGIILNKTTPNDFYTSQDVENLMKTEVLGSIELNHLIPMANHYKDSILNLYPLDRSSLGFKKIASDLLNEYFEFKVENKGFFSRFVKLK